MTFLLGCPPILELQQILLKGLGDMEQLECFFFLLLLFFPFVKGFCVISLHPFCTKLSFSKLPCFFSREYFVVLLYISRLMGRHGTSATWRIFPPLLCSGNLKRSPVSRDIHLSLLWHSINTLSPLFTHTSKKAESQMSLVFLKPSPWPMVLTALFLSPMCFRMWGLYYDGVCFLRYRL